MDMMLNSEAMLGYTVKIVSLVLFPSHPVFPRWNHCNDCVSLQRYSMRINTNYVGFLV